MFHLQSLELLHWDYCERLTLPLDGAIITVAGPNGSGKTTLLDAMRTLLGLECSGGRNYKTYARHANADSAWLRATVDNRPRGRQTSTRPFATSLMYSDQVTLACRIDRNGGDWRRRYCMREGDVPIEALVDVPDKDWLGLEGWRGRLERAGLSRAIARVLALEQGQTDRLCEYSSRELLRLVFDVFGDQDVLDRYEEARRHQREVSDEVEAARRELAHGQGQLAQLDARVNLYRQYRAKTQERQHLATEVMPVLEWKEQREDLTARARDIDRQRKAHNQTLRQQSADRRRFVELLQERGAAEADLAAKEQQRQASLRQLEDARLHEREVEQLLAQAETLKEVARIESDAQGLVAHIEQLERDKERLDAQWHDLSGQRSKAQESLNALLSERKSPEDPDVRRFRAALRGAGIGHHVLAEVVDIADARWRAAAEGVLRGLRWMIMLERGADEARAMALAERERYRHYVVPDAVQAPGEAPAHSLLSVLRFSDTVPRWLLRQMEQIRRVESTEEGAAVGGEWVTREAYLRDGRGGRSVWIEPERYQFGAAAFAARSESLHARLAELDARLSGLDEQRSALARQRKAANEAAQGHRAAEELVRRGDEFEQARQRLPQAREARRAASEAWSELDAACNAARTSLQRARDDYEATDKRLKEAQAATARYEREWAERRQELRAEVEQSNAMRRRLPAAWIAPDALDALRLRYGNSTQARLRDESLEQELAQGEWETDPAVEERRTLMAASVAGQEGQLRQREASNEAAGIAVGNARERYIDVLRSTVRRYRKNIIELGQLAGVEVSVDPPHLDNDDAVLRQAELKVRFNFDGKGQIGLNDGEASGGQQVIKSLILLVGLLKDDEMSGGFVFIDEPFAHLDVRNIQLVGHFLKATRAQYVLTTPITHNVEVFEPADVTLVTSKKPPGARWAPPIGVLQRRAEAP